MASPKPITLTDKLMLFPNITRTIASILTRLLTRPFISGAKASDFFKDVIYAGVRTNLSITNSATEQFINPTTESGYRDLAKKHGFQPDTDVLNHGLRLHWIGPKSASKVFLYCHGGGYALSASPGHWVWLCELQRELATSQSISVCVIEYTLSYYAQYPTQLRQAVEALDKLVNGMGKKPSDIIIGGDSAGGNLALAVLSHILHPHPEISTKIDLKEPLAGAILISPWASFATTDNSVTRCAGSDYVTAAVSKRWSGMYLGPKPSDAYTEAVKADGTWFKNLSSTVKEILIWGGGGEVLIDSINVIAKVLKDAHEKVELVVQPGAAHEDFIIEKVLGYSAEAEGTQVVRSWIKARL